MTTIKKALVTCAGGFIGHHLVRRLIDEGVRPQASEVERLITSNEKAKELYGCKPAVSLEDDLRRTVAWMRDNADLHNLSGYTI